MEMNNMNIIPSRVKSSRTDDSFSVQSVISISGVCKDIPVCKHSTPGYGYCASHDMMACRTCLVRQHGSCDVHSDTDVSRLCSKDEVRKIVQEIDEIKKHLQDAVKEIGKEKSLLCKEKEKVIQKIKYFKSEMFKRLEELSKEAIDNLELQFSEHKKNAEAQLKYAEMCLTSQRETLQTLTQDRDDSLTWFGEIKHSKKMTSEAHEALHKLNIQIGEIEFVPDQKLFEIMTEVSTLGTCKLSFHRDPTVTYKIIDQGNIRVVPAQGNKDCNITGACRVPDGNVLLTDRSSKKLFRLDIDSNKVRDQLRFSSEPWAICMINSNEAAVSFPEEQKNVKFISIANKLKITRCLMLRHTCRALAFQGDELLVSDQGVYVYVYKLNGILVRKLSKDGLNETRLSDYYSIAVNDNLIVLADWIEGLLAFDRNGKLIWKYDGTDLKRAGGLCFDETGNILACGSQSINVLHIDRNGKKIGEIANTANGLVYPTTLCFDEKRSTLIVAQREADVVLFRVH